MGIPSKRNQLISGSGMGVTWKTARDKEGRRGRATRAAGRPHAAGIACVTPTPTLGRAANAAGFSSKPGTGKGSPNGCSPESGQCLGTIWTCSHPHFSPRAARIPPSGPFRAEGFASKESAFRREKRLFPNSQTVGARGAPSTPHPAPGLTGIPSPPLLIPSRRREISARAGIWPGSGKGRRSPSCRHGCSRRLGLFPPWRSSTQGAGVSLSPSSLTCRAWRGGRSAWQHSRTLWDMLKLSRTPRW